MKVSFKRNLLNQFNRAFAFTGFELKKKGGEFQDYIPFEYTLQEAEKSGVSLSDYIDNNYNVPGTTQLTIDKMRELGVFDHPIHRICEIGPGSGRYLEKVKAICNPDYYEIYETSKSWKEWLVEKYNVIAQPTDGASLLSTPTQSIDLLHTHKVLYGNSILTIFRYFMEMARVVNENGFLVFDLLTAECIDNGLLVKWVESGVDHAHSMTSGSVALDYFASQGFRCCGTFSVPMAPGVTEYFVFKKS